MFHRRRSRARRADSTPRRRLNRRRRLALEPLEERPLLAVMTVTALTDDTLANLAGDSQLSLREAIEAINTQANVDGIGPTSGVFGTNDEIVFNPMLFTGGPQTITLADAVGAQQFSLTRAMTITGPGVPLLKLDATHGTDDLPNTGDGFRIFNVDDGDINADNKATITGLMITGGDVTGEGGAIRSRESLTVRDAVIAGNAAFGANDGGGISIGIASGRTFELRSSRISGNIAGDEGGGVYAFVNSANFLVDRSTISNNEAATGGGIDFFASGSTATISNSTISDNESTSHGGGINAFVSSATTGTISNSTLFNNFSGARGGGIYLYEFAGGIAATISSSTISSNRANDDGGGVFSRNSLGTTTTIAHSTLTGNISDDDLMGGGSGGGLYGTGPGTLVVTHSIIAVNLDSSATAATDMDATSSAPGSLTATFNLIGDVTGSGVTNGVMGNLVGTAAVPIDPLLKPLLPNGGPTRTHALRTGSPALDAGDPAAVAGMGGIPQFDQRGNTFTRVFDGAAPAGAIIDIGAYELQNLGVAQTFIVDILADEDDGDYSPGDLSLREAIGRANGNVGFADTITFASGLNGGTITLVLGELGIIEELTINATSLTSGITIDASGNDLTPGTVDGMGTRIFNINDGDDATDNRVTLIGLTLTGGDINDSGGAIASVDSLTLRNCVVTGNAALSAGGITLYQSDLGAPLTHEITASTISGNSATASSGGGMYIFRGTITINNTTISENSAAYYGGGIGQTLATFTITNSTVSGNSAGQSAGGLSLNYGTSTVVNSTISGNRANLNGGGIVGRVTTGESMTIRHSTITQNIADDNDNGTGTGGGIFLGDPPGDNTTFTLTHTIVAENIDKTDAAPDMDATTNPATTFTRTFNLIGIGSNSGVTNGVMGNQVGSAAVPLDPRLGALVDNGGPTLTHALELDSDAVDAGNSLLAAGMGGVPEFDQRGNPFTRVFDGNGNGTDIIDIGAFEINAFELVLPDDFEPNDTLATATVLGSPPFETIRDLSITAGNGDNIANDIDYFKYTAHYTGQLRVRIHFQGDFGDLDLEIRDMFDNVIDSSLGTTNLEEIIIPVVFQEMYFIRVFGFLPFGEDIADANNYTLEIENFPAPVPTGVVLDPASDTGMMDNDNITSDATPTIFIQTDVLNFVDTNNNGLFQDPDTAPAGTADELDALSPTEANNILNNTPAAEDEDGGIAVEVTFVNTTDGTFVTGFAEAVIGALPDVYRFTPSAPLTPGVYLVTARTRVFDGQANAMDDPDQETGRSNASPPLRLVIDTTGAPANSISADMLIASDTGMFSNDNVTNKMQPAFQGIAPAGSKVRIFANGELVGQSVAGSDTSDVGHAVGGIGGLANDGLGIWEITVEPLADNAYDIRVEVEDAAGNVTEFDPRFNGPNERIDIVIDTVDPNTPFLDLLDDTGRHDNDNITKINKPLFSMTTTDPLPFANVLFTDNLKFRIYDRYESTVLNPAPEVLIYDSAQDPAADAMTTAGDMFTALVQLTKALPFLTPAHPAITAAGNFADGVHNLKLEVEDRAGNISHDFLLEITVDTLTPPISFGLVDGTNNTDGLTASSDSGVLIVPETFADRVTSDTTPTLWGRAEADTIVRLYLDRNNNGVIDLASDPFLGQTTAIPLDGNHAEPNGYWEITSALDLNQLVGLPRDGVRQLLVTAEDVAGNPMPVAVDNLPVINDGVAVLQIFIDTQGPRITDIDLGPGIEYDLFDPKPSTDGPTPLINSLFIDVEDLPFRVDQLGMINDFLYNALVEEIAETIGNYELVGDFVGQVIIQEVIVHFETVVNGQPARASIELVFAQPLPDDRYTFTVRDNLVDPANNRLDGESGNPDPFEEPNFPTGDGVPGGNFVARFTVDSRPEIGVWAAGIIHIDTNGNFYFDPENVDFTNRDLVYTLGFSSDYIFAGNFVLGAGGVADGFDKLAVYGRVGDQWRFLVDFDNDGVPDEEFLAPSINGIPVAGNFDGNAANGDEIAIFTGSAWFFDTNHDFIVDDGFATDYAGFPVAGDFDGDGDDDVATYIASQAGGNFFHIDINTAGLGAPIAINGSADHTFRVGLPGLGTFGFAGVRERPVAADMNADGVDDLGLWVPDGTAILPGDQGEWFFLLSDPRRVRYEHGGDGVDPLTVIDRILGGGLVDFVPFSTTPFGDDLYARFGNSFALPIVGNFDPPVASSASTSQQSTPTAATNTTEASTTQRAVSSVGPNSASSVDSGSPNASTPTTPVVTPASAQTPTRAPQAPAPITTAATTAAAAAKVVVPALTPASSAKQSTTQSTTAAASTEAAKKLAVPAIQTTKSVKKATTVTTPAKSTTNKTTSPTPAAVVTAKSTAKVAKPATTSTKKAAAPVKSAIAKAVPTAKKAVAKASKSKLATTIIIAAPIVTPPSESLPVAITSLTVPISAPPAEQASTIIATLTPSIHAAKYVSSFELFSSLSQSQPTPVEVLPPVESAPVIPFTYVPPANIQPEVQASMGTSYGSGSLTLSGYSGLQSSTLSGTLEINGTISTVPDVAANHGPLRSAVVDAAIPNLRLLWADIAASPDAIAANEQLQLASTGTAELQSVAADNDDLALLLAWDALLRNNV